MLSPSVVSSPERVTYSKGKRSSASSEVEANYDSSKRDEDIGNNSKSKSIVEVSSPNQKDKVAAPSVQAFWLLIWMAK